ncbi:MAG TPA: hypothetical protein VJ785_01025 [Anaerolineales bacterium]|nr:hypothetical protein [Anaerolineales bacterium]
MKLTRKQFEDAKRTYEEAVKERARQIKIMKDELGWTFDKIGDEFGISRQAAQNIYKNLKDEEA